MNDKKNNNTKPMPKVINATPRGNVQSSASGAGNHNPTPPKKK